jgi:hypothetical protein
MAKELYILTDARNFTTATKPDPSFAQKEVERCSLLAPIRVARWEKCGRANVMEGWKQTASWIINGDGTWK